MNSFSGKPARLGSLLGSLIRTKGIAEQSSVQHLEDIWKQAAGERIAAKSCVKRLRSGVLEVTVSNGAVLEELTCYLKHDLLETLQHQHPDPVITSLKFVRVR